MLVVGTRHGTRWARRLRTARRFTADSGQDSGAVSARGFTSVFCVLMMFLAILFIGRLPYAKRLAPKNLAPKTRARRLTGSCCAYTNVNYKPWVRFPHWGAAADPRPWGCRAPPPGRRVMSSLSVCHIRASTTPHMYCLYAGVRGAHTHRRVCCAACWSLDINLRVAELHGGSTGALLTARHCTRGHASVHICLSDVTPRSRATRRTSAGVGRQGRQQPGPASPLKGRSPRRSIRPPGSWVVSGGGWNRRLEAAGASTQVGLPWEC